VAARFASDNAANAKMTSSVLMDVSVQAEPSHWEDIFPDKVRCGGHTWSLTLGYAVVYRLNTRGIPAEEKESDLLQQLIAIYKKVRSVHASYNKSGQFQEAVRAVQRKLSMRKPTKLR